MIIKTKNFILRPFKPSDAQAIVKNINHKKISKYTSAIPYPYSLLNARSWLKKTIKQYDLKVPNDFVLAIEIGGEVVGGIGLHKIVPGHKAEIGYWLNHNFWGKGIMTQAVKKITAYAFYVLKLKRVHAKVMKPNLASKKVLEKNGFVLEGMMKKEFKKGNKYLDVYLLAKVK